MRTAFVLMLTLTLFAQDGKQDVASKIKYSFKKGADWLVKNQTASGAWEQALPDRKVESMALTCLAVYALAKAPEDVRGSYAAAINNGIGYIVSKQDKDGSFAEPPGVLRTYITSLALMCMAAADKEKYKEQIKKAQDWLKSAQATEGVWAGGHGYGDKEISNDGKVKESKAADLSNTAMAAQAMYESGLDKNDAYWKKIAEFVARCQNNSETNVDPAWKKALEEKGFKIGNDGSVFYAPNLDDLKAAAEKDPADAKMVIVGYGSMTYAAIKTFLFAGLGKDDPRLTSAVEWVRNHWTLDRHPGFPHDENTPAAKRTSNMGLYYYYMMLARALDAWGENPFKTKKGDIDWPKALGEKLVSLQKDDGTWANENPRWWEGNPALCTPYVLHIYGTILRNVK